MRNKLLGLVLGVCLLVGCETTGVSSTGESAAATVIVPILVAITDVPVTETPNLTAIDELTPTIQSSLSPAPMIVTKPDVSGCVTILTMLD